MQRYELGVEPSGAEGVVHAWGYDFNGHHNGYCLVVISVEVLEVRISWAVRGYQQLTSYVCFLQLTVFHPRGRMMNKLYSIRLEYGAI